MNIIKDSYENGECPDCGKNIPDDVSGGDGCSNCGHIFYGRPDYGMSTHQKAHMQQVMLHAYRDINFLLKEGFDTNVDDCEIDGVKDTIKELNECLATYKKEIN